MNKHYRVIILAAGIGKRINEYTKTVPKCLIPIKRRNQNTSILEYQINKLLKLNIKNIKLVIGNEGDCWNVESLKKINVIWSDIAVNYQNISKKRNQSIVAGIESIDNGPLLVIDGDILFKSEIIKLILLNNNNIITAMKSVNNQSDLKSVIDVKNNFVTKIGYEKTKANSLFYNGITKINKENFNSFKDIVTNYENENASLSDILSIFILKNSLSVIEDNTIINVNRINDLNKINE